MRDGWLLPGLAILENKPSILRYLLQRYSPQDESNGIGHHRLPVSNFSILAVIRYTPANYQIVEDWYQGNIDRAPATEW
jgi:hypothetical protein